jgi:hypothetical protein
LKTFVAWKAEDLRVTEGANLSTVMCTAEGMSRIEDCVDAVPLRDPLECVGVARPAQNVNRR